MATAALLASHPWWAIPPSTFTYPYGCKREYGGGHSSSAVGVVNTAPAGPAPWIRARKGPRSEKMFDSVCEFGWESVLEVCSQTCRIRKSWFGTEWMTAGNKATMTVRKCLGNEILRCKGAMVDARVQSRGILCRDFCNARGRKLGGEGDDREHECSRTVREMRALFLHAPLLFCFCQKLAWYNESSS